MIVANSNYTFDAYEGFYSPELENITSIRVSKKNTHEHTDKHYRQHLFYKSSHLSVV